MINIDFSKRFDKQFGLLQKNQQRRVTATILIFRSDPYAPHLRNHPLKGEWRGYRSISVGGDLRIHYKELPDNRVLLVAIGSHSQMYK